MRKSLKNTSEVYHYFANQVQPEGYIGNVSFNGNDFYSYRTIVAKRIKNSIVISSRSYSVTTSEHVSDLRQACRHLSIVYIPCVEDGIQTNKLVVESRINALFKLASTARTKKDYYLSKALNIVNDFNTYCDLIDNQVVKIDPAIFDDIDLEALRKAEKHVQAVALEERKARALEDALGNSEKITQWLSGERDNLGYHVSNDTLLRVKGEVIHTSRGAEIPLNATGSLWRLVSLTINNGIDLELNKRIGVYTLTKIEASGNITVGCHYIKFEQLERIAKILGYI